MKLAKLLFKPKWQDKNPDVRRIAVATDDDAELIVALPELTRTDSDAGVRLAALKRLDDYERWRERSTADSDDSIRRVARTAYLAKLCGNVDDGPPLSRRIAELETLSSDEIERVATQSTLRELRADALRRLHKPALLVDRALNDPDSGLRLESLERVSDPALLEKIAERARKTDKTISRRARERAESMRVDQGDARAIMDRARGLCERAELLMRNVGTNGAEAFAAIADEWKNVAAAAPAEFVRRFEGARDVILAPPLVKTEAKPVEIIDAPIIEAQAKPKTDSIASQSRFDAALSAATALAQRERQQRDEAIAELTQQLPEYEAAIESGDSAKSAQLRQQIDTKIAAIGELPMTLHRKLAPLHERAGELQRWLHWSTNQRRKAICAEIESLTHSLHPDALATRVRELRDEWQKLAASGDAPEALERRFQGLANRTMKGARPYFNKRDELRRAHSAAVTQLLARADAVSETDQNWKSIIALRTELSTALHTLDQVDPRDRKDFAHRIKMHSERFGESIRKHDDDVFAAKQNLIERAVKLSDGANPRDTSRQARELQSEWTALGNGRRSADQKQWREFRAACDAAFGKLDEDRKAREETFAAQRQAAVAVVERAETMAAGESSSEELKAQLRELDRDWAASAIDDSTIKQRFRHARDSITRAISDAVRQKRLSRFTKAIEFDSILRNAESGSGSGSFSANDASASTSEFAASFAKRIGQLTAGESIATADIDEVRRTLVLIESLASIDSPAEDHALRMALNVERLSQRVRSRQQDDFESELTNALSRWFELPGKMDAAYRQRFERAAAAALEKLP